MNETWTYTAHRYAIAESVSTDAIRYHCPQCRADVGAIEHGQTVNCSKCNLSIVRYGNELECTASNTEQAAFVREWKKGR